VLKKRNGGGLRQKERERQVNINVSWREKLLNTVQGEIIKIQAKKEERQKKFELGACARNREQEQR
jgi:hypothetical protein